MAKTKALLCLHVYVNTSNLMLNYSSSNNDDEVRANRINFKDHSGVQHLTWMTGFDFVDIIVNYKYELKTAYI